jgi:general secretion pathway protein D
MNRAICITALIVSTVLVAPALAQQEQNRGAPTRTLPPQGAPAPAADAPVVVPVPPPLSPAAAEAQRRRDEASVDLTVLLARVAEATGKKFLVDPRVRAQVTAVPSIGTPTYAELLTILRLHGYAAAEVGGRVNIIPDANIRFMPGRVLERDDDSIPDDEVVTRIITVRNAPYFVAILRPLMPQSAHLAAFMGDENGNQPAKLILMDTYANVRRITEIVNALSR